MNNRPIGIFDLGTGGLAVAREVRRLLPREEIVYIGDTLCAPGELGTREEARILAAPLIKELQERSVKIVLCADSVASALLEAADWNLGVPYLDVIHPAARAACGVSAQGRIGVIARTEVVRGGVFAKAIHSIHPGAKVLGNAAPLLIPLVEDGMCSLKSPAVKRALEKYLAPLARERIDTLLLGCAHYSRLYDSIGELLQYRINLVDSGTSAAHDLQAELCEEGLLADRKEAGEVRCFIRGEDALIPRMAGLFLGRETPYRAERIA